MRSCSIATLGGLDVHAWGVYSVNTHVQLSSSFPRLWIRGIPKISGGNKINNANMA
jgi:hypothetical protein